MEALQTIAMLCAISAGDKLSAFNMAEIIESKQKQCHLHYATCFKKKIHPLDCVIRWVEKKRVGLPRDEIKKVPE